MSRQRVIVVTAGIMLSLFMASMEGTVIATAMPTIVAQLGGLSIYSWAFSAYMLTSTTTVPVYGKLSDLYGRRSVYAVAMGIFLLGSVLCGLSQSMEQLIFFRAVQGLGAGGVLPLVFIIVGDMFSFEQRARMQGLFSGVWGVSSIVGPLLGGFLVDQWSWHWVFYVNVIPGIIALFVVWFAWQDPHEEGKTVQIDYWGALLLTTATVVLLLGLSATDTMTATLMIAAAIVLYIVLFIIERRVPEPILPLPLFKQRLFSVATLHGALSGWAMFGSLSFVPLFVQAVLGTTATEAGRTLTPMMLGWVAASVVGSRLLLHMNYRTIIFGGTIMLSLGSFLMTRAGADTPLWQIMTYLGMMGVGMGMSIPGFLIAVQSSVTRRQMGAATSTLQFSRSIGGTLGVSVMGAFLVMRLSSALTAAGMDPTGISLDGLLERGPEAPVVDGALREALAIGVEGVFILAFAAAAIGLLVALAAPAGRIGQIRPTQHAEPQEPATPTPVSQEAPRPAHSTRGISAD
jgi:EmrB/QacA subfamily drug resistance transporter